MEGIEGEVINLESDFEITVGDLAALISLLMGREISLRSEDKRIRPEASEVTRLWASTKKAQQLLGWRPRFGGLEGLREGLKQTIEWFSIPTNLARYNPNHYAI